MRGAFDGMSAGALRGIGAALRSGQLGVPLSRMSLTRVAPSCSDAAARELLCLSSEGLQAIHLALLVDAFADAIEARLASGAELVWTGPETAGAHSRDTAVVVSELFRTATKSVLVSSFALRQPETVFKPLAERMAEISGLRVQLFVHVGRSPRDTRYESEILREFAIELGAAWPGTLRPLLYFWLPSDYYAFRGAPGSPFFFRLLSPRNVIGGFGYVQRYARLPEWLAWECFGEGNGAPSLQVLSARLAAIRAKTEIKGTGNLQQIGCIILADVVFFPKEMWVRQPSDWAKQNLRYTGYSLEEGEGLRIWNESLPLAALLGPSARDEQPVMVELPARYGEPTMVPPRLGQGAFRVAVTDAYQRACAVTGCAAYLSKLDHYPRLDSSKPAAHSG